MHGWPRAWQKRRAGLRLGWRTHAAVQARGGSQCTHERVGEQRAPESRAAHLDRSALRTLFSARLASRLVAALGRAAAVLAMARRQCKSRTWEALWDAWVGPAGGSVGTGGPHACSRASHRDDQACTDIKSRVKAFHRGVRACTYINPVSGWSHEVTGNTAWQRGVCRHFTVQLRGAWKDISVFFQARWGRR